MAIFYNDIVHILQRDNVIPDQPINESTTEADISAEMLIAIPDRIPSQFLVPPPFPPPLSVLIKRRPQFAMISARRNFEERQPVTFHRHKMNRFPVNSIQDILNQMERESNEFDRASNKRPKRINFYGRYRHRPNRPKVIPIPSHVNVLTPAVQENNPYTAKEVNHLITQSPVPQHVFYPKPTTSDVAQSNGLYDQILATNKNRHETAKDAKPFSLMLDIYPMTENQTTTTTYPPPPPPRLPPLQIDHSYYNSIPFPQIHPFGSVKHSQPMSTIPPSEQPEKMVVHLNLYPTKKNRNSNKLFEPDPNFFVNEQEGNDFMPILNPQIYYRSRSAEDETNSSVIKHVKNFGQVVDIPKRPEWTRQATGIPKVRLLETIDLGPAININDYKSTITPQVINKFFYDNTPYRHTYFDNTNSNGIERRVDVQELSTTEQPKHHINLLTTSSKTYQRNSHQPDNPMLVEKLSGYLEKK